MTEYRRNMYSRGRDEGGELSPEIADFGLENNIQANKMKGVGSLSN